MNVSDSELAPSSVGCLIDERPLLTPAVVRPYIVAIVLHRGAVRTEEVYSALIPHCPDIDIKVGAESLLTGDWLEYTRLEEYVDYVLGEMVAAKLLRYNEELELWVAHESSLTTWVSYACQLNAQLPKHLVKQ